MRLIDADAIEYLRNVTCFSNGSCEYTEITYRNWVDRVPTVDAVPVEFIEKHVQIAKECDDPIASYHMDWIVAQWRIENGQTD